MGSRGLPPSAAPVPRLPIEQPRPGRPVERVVAATLRALPFDKRRFFKPEEQAIQSLDGSRTVGASISPHDEGNVRIIAHN